MPRHWRIAYRLRYLTFACWTSALLCYALVLAVPLASNAIDADSRNAIHEWYESFASLGGIGYSFDTAAEGLCLLVYFLVLLAAVKGSGGSVQPGRATLPFRLSAALAAALLAASIILWATSYRPFVTVTAYRQTSVMQTIKSQLMLYQVQHDGQYPPADRFWERLTEPTSTDHSISADGQHGPYLQRSPRNPFTNGTVVAMDLSGDWRYEPRTGRFSLVVPMNPQGVLYLETSDFNDIDRDVALRTTEPLAKSIGPLITYLFMGEIEGSSWPPLTWSRVPFAVLIALIGTLAYLRLTRWLSKGNVTARMTGVSVILLLGSGGILAAVFWTESMNWFREAILCLAFVLFWSAGVIIYLQYSFPRHQRWASAPYCLRCEYDLRGTIAASRKLCPECGAPVP